MVNAAISSCALCSWSEHDGAYVLSSLKGTSIHCSVWCLNTCPASEFWIRRPWVRYQQPGHSLTCLGDSSVGSYTPVCPTPATIFCGFNVCTENPFWFGLVDPQTLLYGHTLPLNSNLGWFYCLGLKFQNPLLSIAIFCHLWFHYSYTLALSLQSGLTSVHLQYYLHGPRWFFLSLLDRDFTHFPPYPNWTLLFLGYFSALHFPC